MEDAPRISSFGIEVGDLERSLAFYTEVLGLTVTFTIDNDDLHEVGVSDGQGGPAILLMRHKHAPVPVPAAGAKDQKIVFITTDVVALHATAVASGSPSDREPTPYPGTDITIAMVRDPDGYLVEMIQTA
jgi:lactoylglutathione lyase